MPDRWQQVAIIGVGAIGASIGLALRKRQLATRVVGATRTPASAEAALELGAVDEIASSLEEASRQADLIVVCTPVLAIADHVRQCAAAAPPTALITDGGSTKATLADALKSLPNASFVGSHPLAGTHESGPRAGNADLFQGRRVIVTPVDQTPGETVEGITRFWAAVGAEVECMSPDLHDRLLAHASHLPHLIASTLAAATPEDALKQVATGWKDSTRIAQGSVELWRQILLDNRVHTLKALEDFEKTLRAMKDAIQRQDSQGLSTLLQQGKQIRDVVGN